MRYEIEYNNKIVISILTVRNIWNDIPVAKNSNGESATAEPFLVVAVGRVISRDMVRHCTGTAHTLSTLPPRAMISRR
jgi:hypothetical protein